MSISQEYLDDVIKSIIAGCGSKKTITSDDLCNKLAEYDASPDQVDYIYKVLDENKIVIVDSYEKEKALIDQISKDVSIEDPVKMYLKDIGKYALLSTEEEIEYAEKHNSPLKITRETNYSKDKNLWHLSHEGLDLEDPANEPDYDKICELGVSPWAAPDKPTYLTIHFEKGIPTAIDGVEMDSVALIDKLNKIGGANGVGLCDMVENRLVGMKSRGVYETPGGTILYTAHELLESICLDKATMHYKQMIAIKFGEMVYDGQWFTPLREALTAFVNETQKTVTGDVKLKVYKGNVMNAGVTSPYSLYSETIATFDDDGGAYHQNDAEGFINLFGLPIKVKALLESNKLK